MRTNRVLNEKQVNPLHHQHITVLDGFRGLAILMVIAMHYTGLPAGWSGVDLFFVLSGFLITWRLQQSLNGPKYFQRFYLNRLLRICPLYFAVLLVCFVLFPVLAPTLINPSYRELLSIQRWYWTFTQNFYNAAYGWPGNISIVHFWSLATEMQFYLVWPFVIRFLHKRPTWLMAVLLMLPVLAILFRNTAADFLPVTALFRYVLLPSRIDAFALGALLFILIHRYHSHFKNLFLLIGILSTILLVILYTRWLFVDYSANFTSRFGYTLFDICWFGWLGYGLLVDKNNPLRAVCSNRFMVSTGKYSYALYIFHYPVWTFVNRLLENRYGNGVKDNWWGEAALPFVVFTVVYILAIASYHCFEKYFLRLKSR